MTVYQEKLSRAEELLVLALKEKKSKDECHRVLSIYREIGDEEIYQAAVRNKVVPMVAHGLMESVPSEELPVRWQQAHSDVERKLAIFFAELDRLGSICEKQGIRIVAIENGGIARGVQKCHGCFASSDIEILVTYDRLEEFEQILSGEGYEARSRERCASENKNQWDRDVCGWDNYCKILQDDVVFWLNVQWRPILRRWIPMEYGLKSDDLIDRSIPIKNSDTYVRILSPEDNLLVCALHVASHSYVRGIGIRLQLDVDRLVRHVEIDWGHFLALVKKHQAEELVFPSLAIPHGLIGTPIPKEIFPKLVPSKIKRRNILGLISQAGVLNRESRKFSPIHIVRLEIALAKGGIISGLRRVFFPPLAWVKEGYRSRKHYPIVYCYLDRLIDLAKRRGA